MPIEMHKGKNSKVVDNRDVRQHRKDGWVFQKPSPTIETKKPARTRKPRATLKADPIVKQVNDLPDTEDFNLNIIEE